MLILWILILIISMAALIKGADWFTEGAEDTGVRLGIPPFVVGVTIVSIGTSLPELASSIAAVLQGSSEIVLGNVVGSNIANTLFVLGLGAVIGGGILTNWDLRRDLRITIGATIIVFIASFDRQILLWESLVLLALFGGYLFYVLSHRKKQKRQEPKRRGMVSAIMLLGGLIFVIVGAQYLVTSVVQLSTLLGISAAVIGASVVAFGTSVPEAVVTCVAAFKKKKEIAIGNVIGSNIFNLLFITGAAGLFGRVAVGPMILAFAFPVVIAATVLLWYVLRDKHISSKAGWLFLGLYAVYLIGLFWKF